MNWRDTHMAILEIKDQQFEAKGSFAFARKADELLGEILKNLKQAKKRAG